LKATRNHKYDSNKIKKNKNTKIYMENLKHEKAHAIMIEESTTMTRECIIDVRAISLRRDQLIVTIHSELYCIKQS